MQKNAMLLEKIMYQKKPRQTVTIALAGTHPGAGTTYLAVLLSNYLAVQEGEKVACVEACGHHDLELLEEAVSGFINPEPVFRFRRVDYCKSAVSEDITSLYSESYDYIVLDFGCNLINQDFLRSNFKFIVGSLTKWKIRYLKQWFDKNWRDTKKEDLSCLLVFAKEREIKAMKDFINVPVYGIRFEQDPFIVSKETAKLFQWLVYKK